MPKKSKLLPGERGSDIPHPVDVHVGKQLKLKRTLVGLTQGALGERIGLTFQQIQKYEHGANRVSASKLWQLSNVLSCSVEYFFEDMPESVRKDFPGYEGYSSEADVPEEELTLYRRQTLSLVRVFLDVKDQNIRTQVNKMVKALTGVKEEE